VPEGRNEGSLARSAWKMHPKTIRPLRDGMIERHARDVEGAMVFKMRTDACNENLSRTYQPPIVPSLRDGFAWGHYPRYFVPGYLR